MSTHGQAINVRTIGNAILGAVIAHWEGAPGLPLPDRRCLVPGVPNAVAWDCEQLTVALSGVGWGPAVESGAVTPKTGSNASVFAVRHAVFAVQLVRCTPGVDAQGKAPTAAALQAAGEQFMLDAGLLSQALVRWASLATDGLPNDMHSMVQLGVIEAGPAQGKLVAVEGSAIITAAGLEG